MDWRRTAGGILRLLEIHEAHPAEFAYDFRSRFGLSFDDIGTEISWLDAVYLVSILMRDPESWLQAAQNEWKYPVSREHQVLTNLYDLTARVNAKSKPKPYPVPWPVDGTKRLGSKRKQNREDVLRLLDKMNPKEN